MTLLTPATDDQLVEAIKSANQNNSPLEIIGGGSKRSVGRKPFGRPISMSAFSGITSYEPEEMVITAQAGTSLLEIESALRSQGQCLAFEPPSSTTLWSEKGAAATIGGTIAAAVSGPRRFAVGAARDHLLGFRAVNGKGELFKGGGKVVKNVTGYDLPKLAAGSFGTLFAMTEVTLRTFPAARATIGVSIPGLEMATGLACLRKLSMSPLEPTGLSYLPRESARQAFGIQHSLTLIRFEGDRAGASARAADAVAMVGTSAEIVDDEMTIVRFRAIADAAPLLDDNADIWRLSIPPTEAGNAISKLSPTRYLADWAGGLLWLQMPTQYNPATIHAVAASNGGHATWVRRQQDATDLEDVFPPMDAATTVLTARLKQAFDPGRVLNRGRMYKDI
ncbi:MAG: glycolate oxidase subunit GlcE [Micropepsaceae bacterium]